jgi:hypothetical protein
MKERVQYAVIREYYPGEEQVTFGEHPGMFSTDQRHIKQDASEMYTIGSMEKKYGIRLEWREAKAKTHWGWFVKK